MGVVEYYDDGFDMRLMLLMMIDRVGAVLMSAV